MFDKFHLDVRKAVNVLDGEIFAVVDKLPFADVIREMLDDFDAQVRETVDDLYFDVAVVFDNFDFTSQTDSLVVAILINRRSRKYRRCEEEQQQDSQQSNDIQPFQHDICPLCFLTSI